MKRQSFLLVVISLFTFSIVFGQTPNTISGGVLNGKATRLPKPEYPAAARAVGACGTATVQVLVDEEGKVTSASAASGHPLLRSSSVRAAMQAEFVPTTLSGKPVKVSGVLVYNFACGEEQNTRNTESIEETDTIAGGMVNGKAKLLPVPEYSAEARAAGACGMVNVQVVIDTEGKVISASAVSGSPLLESAAVNAARQAEFTPTTISGQPVNVTGAIVYNFACDEMGRMDESIGTIDEQWTINGGVVNGKALGIPKPGYPAAARAVGARGSVQVKILIDEEGSVISAEAISGHPLLRQASVEAARGAKFSPTMLDGIPVRVSGVLVYVFELPEQTDNKPAF